MELDSKIQSSKNILITKKKISEYYCIQKDETVIKVGSEYIWIWVATIELESKEILRISVSKEQNMFLLLLNDLFRML